MHKLSLSLLTTLSMFLGACTSSDIPLVPKSPMYTSGKTDGCSTANGTYTKNSENFRNDVDYQEGWFAGRKNCNPIHDAK